MWRIILLCLQVKALDIKSVLVHSTVTNVPTIVSSGGWSDRVVCHIWWFCKVRQREGGLLTALPQRERRALYFVREERRRAAPLHRIIPLSKYWEEEQKKSHNVKSSQRTSVNPATDPTQPSLNLCLASSSGFLCSISRVRSTRRRRLTIERCVGEGEVPLAASSRRMGRSSPSRTCAWALHLSETLIPFGKVGILLPPVL